jgi:hypothetical protein
VITIGHDHIRLPLKGFQIPYDRASEKIILRKFRLVQQNLCPFGPDPFHDALDTGGDGGAQEADPAQADSEDPFA